MWQFVFSLEVGQLEASSRVATVPDANVLRSRNLRVGVKGNCFPGEMRVKDVRTFRVHLL